MFSHLTHRLARSVHTQSQYPTRADGAHYSEAHLDEPGRAPSDYGPMPVDGRRASLQEPAYSLPPTVSLEEVQESLLALYPLRDTFQGMFFDFIDQRETEGGEALFALRNSKLPLRWAYVALANGLYVIYPGSRGLPSGYDARDRFWYADAVQGRGRLVWTAPYYGMHDGVLGFAALKAVTNDDGTLLGVVGVDIEVGELISTMVRRAASRDSEMFILDGEGRVLTSSGRQAPAAQEKGRADTATLEMYAYPEVVAALTHNHAGFVEIAKAGKHWIFVDYQALPTRGWYYVEEAKGERLMER